MAISDYNTTASNNTTIGGTNIDEGCSPAGINNAIRQVMADLADAAAVRAHLDVAEKDGTETISGTWTLSGNPVFSGDPVFTGSPDFSGVSNAGAILGALGMTGAVLSFAMVTAPTGWLACDGAAVSRTTYAALFTAIGTTYGAGDGSTTFNLPDLRGEFVRGWDNGAGNDPDAASRTDRGDGTTGDNVGTKQTDEFESHSHVQNGWGNGTGTGTFNASTGEGTNRNVQSTDATGGNETRPRNIALLYCIKT